MKTKRVDVTLVVIGIIVFIVMGYTVWLGIEKFNTRITDKNIWEQVGQTGNICPINYNIE